MKILSSFTPSHVIAKVTTSVEHKRYFDKCLFCCQHSSKYLPLIAVLFTQLSVIANISFSQNTFNTKGLKSQTSLDIVTSHKGRLFIYLF